MIFFFFMFGFTVENIKENQLYIFKLFNFYIVEENK